MIAVAVAVLAGYLAGFLHGPAALWLLALAVCASRLRTARGRGRAAWLGATAGLSLLLGLHILPGFSNPAIIRDALLSPGAQPYSQYVNFDKTLGGVLLLGGIGWRPLRSKAAWAIAIRRTAPLILATVAVAMAGSLALGFVRFEPRWTQLFWLWAAINLLTTCVSEEAFFRQLLQTELGLAFRSWRSADAIAVAGSAVLFGLAHAAGGWRYALLACLAGGGYAVVYQRTTRLEMAILAHFAVNAVHFLLFTYPALA